MRQLRVPDATYRLQLHGEFRFADAQALVPYLHALGVTDLYASPILRARRGSTHGYDVTDPTVLNPELGGEEAFAALADALRQHDMGLLLDIVPNHMAATSENPWWADVLRHGPRSPYAPYFDVDWDSPRPGLRNKVLLPVLGDHYGRVLEAGELALELAEDGFWVRYYEHRFPLRPRSYAQLLGYRLDALVRDLGREHPAAQQLVALTAEAERLEDGPTPAFDHLREALWRVYNASPQVQAFVHQNIRHWNGRQGDPRSFDDLDWLLVNQNYRLAYWRVASEEINYRRFFDIADLVSMHAWDEQVFAAMHARILQLVAAGQVTGLRIDHVDGLWNPAGYLWRLLDHVTNGTAGPSPTPPPRSPEPQRGAEGDDLRFEPVRATVITPRGVEDTDRPMGGWGVVVGLGFYVVVEKILSGDEELPREGWPVAGTTGYEFATMVNGLFVDPDGAAALDDLYLRFTGDDADFADVAYAQKRRVMAMLFAGEVRSLARHLGALAAWDRQARDLTLGELEEALVAVTACLPVYRTYTNDLWVTDRDRAYIEEAVAAAKRRNPAGERAYEFLRRVLLVELRDPHRAEEGMGARFAMRWQVFTGPVTAKGVEDTALYVYPRLLSLNDVGGEPGRTGRSVPAFHRWVQARQARWPHTLNATSTHDTKRSEDVRARIDVLSEIAAAWAARAAQWRRWNEAKKERVRGQPVPGGNAELLLYQTLLGAWPLRDAEVPEFRERLQAYLVKASREAKVHTSWHDPDPAYEGALATFVDRILEPGAANPFLADFLQPQRPVAYYGALGSLAQVLLKLTAPGVPDLYRGTELWDFSLVDPDNRRPVDFERRAELLRALQAQEAAGLPDLTRELLAHWDDGRIKLYLTYRALHFRRAHADLFAAGDYLPLAATGEQGDHVCAFARHHEGTWALVVVPRLVARLMEKRAQRVGDAPRDQSLVIEPPLGEAVWGESTLLLPANAPNRWRNLLTGEALAVGARRGAPGPASNHLPLAGVFRDFPVALLVGEEQV